MSNSYYNYDNVVRVIEEVYSESANACNAINEASLTPEEFYQVASKNVVDTGIKYRVDGNGNVNSVFNTMNTKLSDGNVAQSAINSNVQTGTASQSANVQYAAQSTVNQSGKVELSPGVTKYKSGHIAPTTGYKAVIGSVASGIAAYAAGVSAGKFIDSLIYSRNPAFFDSIGLNTLNPATWATITSDMSDTGTEGALKTAFNFLLGIEPDGTTQPYIEADAYNYSLYALAQEGMFDSGETTYTIDTSQGTFNPSKFALQSPVMFVQSIRYTSPSGTITEGYVDDGATIACIAGPTRWGIWAITTQTGKKFHYRYIYPDSTPERTGTYDIYTNMSYTYQSAAHTFRYYEVIYQSYTGYSNIRNEVPFTESTQDGKYQDNGYYPMLEAAMYRFSGTPHSSQTVPGVSNQEGATIPDISSADTQQQVADKIAGALPDLYNNRIEQSVVQPDGTVVQKIYYPVPIPTKTTNITTTQPHTITIDQPIRIILPDGATITLPDGTTVTGDGVSIITLPPGTYTLPTGTKVIGNPIGDPEGNPGDTQANPEVNDNSTDTAKDLIRDTITQPAPVPAPDPDPSPQPDEDAEPTNPNPSDTGDGNTPVPVTPIGSASAMYSVYNPSLSEINSLGAWLWSSNFIDQLLKMFNDPMQAIIGLHKTYITPAVSGRGDIKVGYLNSGVQANLVPTQYSTMDCGSVNLPEYFGNVFDYSPYTRVYIYLPFIGFKELDVSQVMRSRIGVKYRGDAYTGTGLAEISVTRDSGAGGVLYTYGCECAVRYPLSQGSYMGFASAVAGLAVGIASGNVAPALIGFSHGSSHPAVEHSGAFSGNSGAMGIKKPYLVVMRPQTAMADNYKHYSGRPSNALVTIGDTSGLIRVRECHVDSINYATDEEKRMIETALKQGVLVS